MQGLVLSAFLRCRAGGRNLGPAPNDPLGSAAPLASAPPRGGTTRGHSGSTRRRHGLRRLRKGRNGSPAATGPRGMAGPAQSGRRSGEASRAGRGGAEGGEAAPPCHSSSAGPAGDRHGNPGPGPAPAHPWESGGGLWVPLGAWPDLRLGGSTRRGGAVPGHQQVERGGGRSPGREGEGGACGAQAGPAPPPVSIAARPPTWRPVPTRHLLPAPSAPAPCPGAAWRRPVGGERSSARLARAGLVPRSSSARRGPDVLRWPREPPRRRRRQRASARMIFTVPSARRCSKRP